MVIFGIDVDTHEDDRRSIIYNLGLEYKHTLRLRDLRDRPNSKSSVGCQSVQSFVIGHLDSRFDFVKIKRKRRLRSSTHA